MKPVYKRVYHRVFERTVYHSIDLILQECVLLTTGKLNERSEPLILILAIISELFLLLLQSY